MHSRRSFPYGSLPANLAAFCALLRREYGFRIGPRDLQDSMRALELTDLGDDRAVRDVLRPVLSSRPDDVRVFDAAFERFFLEWRTWEGRAGPAAAPPERSEDRHRQTRTGDDRAREGRQESADALDVEPGELRGTPGTVVRVGDEDAAAPTGVLRASYSPLDAEGEVPDLEPPDDEWREAARQLARRMHVGLSRRWAPARRGRRFDLRRTLRTSLQTGGEVLMPRWRARVRRRPRFVVLADGSRSMGDAARAALKAAVALTAVARNTETFTFSTALRRVTRDVQRAASGERRPMRLERAWGGGTTIGACLQEFLRRFGDRLVTPETVVIVASDGLDVGDPDLLRGAMERLARQAAAVIWLNPLLDTPGYEPTARGMSLARPFVTALAPARDAAALSALARTVRVR